MLIQITNRCHMLCPHCMQDSNPDGEHMTKQTFREVVQFCIDIMPYAIMITGGEPTEHPQWAEYVRVLMQTPSVKVVCIATNGAWIEDDVTRITMAKLIRSSVGRLKVQVYSHPKYYRNHAWTVAHEKQYWSIGCIPDFSDSIRMQDLGRARMNCQEEVSDNAYSPSCINSHLLATQTTSLHHLSAATALSGKICRPLIDIHGDIHMSESWLCPVVAHVSEGADVVFQKMRASRPCGGCRLYPNLAKFHPQEAALLGIK